MMRRFPVQPVKGDEAEEGRPRVRAEQRWRTTAMRRRRRRC
jgi:hypothetical protein